MKQNVVCLLFISFLSCNGNREETNYKKERSNTIEVLKTFPLDPLFQYHFMILDSAAKTPLTDTMYNCCYNSVNFMEAYTGIEADVEGDYGGATGFKKDDLHKWHQWYDTVKSRYIK